MEADDVRASHLPDRGFQKNARYGLENERRYHSESSSQAKVIENASRLDPDLLMDAPDANQGAPVVDQEGNVLGGNGRAMSIRYAYSSHPERTEKYRAALKANVQRLGLEPGIVDGMNQPMLVRRLEQAPDLKTRQALVSDFNEDFTHSRERRADSKSRGDRFSRESIHALANGVQNADSLRAYFDDPASAQVVHMLVRDGVIQKSEQTAYIGSDGLLNLDGKTLVEGSLRGRVAGSYETLARVSADILGKTDAAIPYILIAENVGPAWSITEDVRQALDLAAAFQGESKKDARTFLDQINLADGKTPRQKSSEVAVAIFEAMLGDKKKEFTVRFAKYAAKAQASPEAGGLPGLTGTRKEEVTSAFGMDAAPSHASKKANFDNPTSENSVPIKSNDPSTPTGGIDLKIGDSIGGSRADTAVRGNRNDTPAKNKYSGPAWKKRYSVVQNTDGTWRILDSITGRVMVRQPFSSAREAEDMLPIVAVGVKHRIYPSADDSYKIVRLVTERKRVVIKDGFESETDAKNYLVRNAEEILAIRTGLGEEVLPAPEKVYRTGISRREGNVTPEDFLKDFGFRGGEFGKWNNQKERQELLNHAYDALMDLADILAIPPRALSLNGELGIAFGARGQGLSGARAHYEPGYAVINLTKMNGAGSLAHEWLHALDNYFARQDGKASSEKEKNGRGDMVYPTASKSRVFTSSGFLAKNSGVRAEVREAYINLVKALYSKAEKYVEDTARAEKFVGQARLALSSTLDGIRKDLSSPLTYKSRNNRAATPEELSRFDELARRLLDGEDLELNFRSNDNPQGRRSRGMAGRWSNDILDGISALYKTVRGRSGFSSDHHGIMDRAAAELRHYKQRADILKSAGKGEEKQKRVPTSYRMDAKRMDEGRSSDYWTLEHEMLARAFSSYVEDKAAAKGIRTDFLVYAANNDNPILKLLGVRPYPQGKERSAFNEAFDKLFKTLEAKVTDKGVALASLKDAPGNTRRFGGLSADTLNDLVGRLGKRAPRSADTHVVQRFEDLPSRIQKEYADHAQVLEGVYDPQTKKMYLVADNLSSPARAMEVWAHEQVVHHGLRGLFTPREIDSLLARLWKDQGGLGNSLIREISERYGIDIRGDQKGRLRVMEEYLAMMAEKKASKLLTDKEESLWRRIVKAVLDAWDKAFKALTGERTSFGRSEMDQLLVTLGQHIMGKPAQGRQLGGAASPAFASLESGEDTAGSMWNQLQEDSARWNEQIDNVRQGKTHPRQILVVGTTPDVLQRLGASGHSMVMHQSVLEKIGREGKHGLPDEMSRRLPELLAAPVMVFQSGTQAGSMVAVLETNHDGMPVVAAVHLDVEQGKLKINQISSVHGRTGGIGWIRREIEAGRRIYADKGKIPAWLRGFSKDQGSRRMSGLQLPGAFVLPNDPRGVKILTEKDVVKPVPPSGETMASLSFGRILGMKHSDIGKLAEVPEIRHFFHEHDLSLLRRTAQLPHWIAKRYPQFQVLYERQLKRMDERAAALKSSLEQVPSLFGPDKLSSAEMAELRSLIWENEGKEIPDLKAKKFLVNGRHENGRAELDTNPAFYKEYSRWLNKQPSSKAAKQAMLEIRKSLDNDLLTAYNRMARMNEVADNDIDNFRQRIGHVHNYFPHHRYGAYFVQAKVGDEVVFRHHFDAATKRGAKKKAREIILEQKRNYPGAAWVDGLNIRLSEDVFGAPLDTEAMEQVIKSAAAKIADKEQAAKIQKALSESVADVLKSRGWGSHAIGRKGIPGHESEDILRVLHDYKAGLQGWLTKMEAAKDFTQALGKINARKDPGLWSYASKYTEDMLRNSDRIDRMAGNIKSVAFAWYLGGSIKTAVVNATQNLVVGVPRLQMDVRGGGLGWLKASGASLVYQLTGSKGKGLTGDEARLIQELYGESVITDAFMEEVRGKLNGVSGAAAWNKFTKVLGMPMSVVERFNRASLALAAYRAAVSGNLKEKAIAKYGIKGKADYEQAKAFASDVVRDAHFVYGKSNAPEWLRSSAAGRAISPMYTFRTFSHNMLNMWHWALTSQGKEGKLFVAKSIGATAVLGGLTALPFYATLMALCQAITGDDDDWTEMIRDTLPQENWLRDIACYGIPSLAGVNIGGSLKMETPFTQGARRSSTPKELVTESLGDILGIPWDLIVEKPSKIMDAHSKGNVWRMIEEAVPTAFKNMMQAWRLATEGQTTMTGRAINDPGEHGARKLAVGEAVGKALGFQPTSSTKSFDAYATRERASQVRSDQIDKLTVLALKTYDTGKPGGMEAVRRRMAEWNREMLSEGKAHLRISMDDVMRRVKSRRRENRLNPQTARQMERMREVWG